MMTSLLTRLTLSPATLPQRRPTLGVMEVLPVQSSAGIATSMPNSTTSSKPSMNSRWRRGGLERTLIPGYPLAVNLRKVVEVPRDIVPMRRGVDRLPTLSSGTISKHSQSSKSNSMISGCSLDILEFGASRKSVRDKVWTKIVTPFFSICPV